MKTNELLRAQILTQVRQFYQAQNIPVRFIPGQTPIPVTAKTINPEDIASLVDAALDGWLTTGRWAAAFEARIKETLGVSQALLCNSGSSANLLAMSALTSPLLKQRRLKPQDEVITVAAAFPSTVNPIIQNGLVPVFVDVDAQTANVDVAALERALSTKTKAIVLAHTLGNPFDLKHVLDFARRHELWTIEDNCDGLGALYQGRPTGSWGDLATLSFYPAHQITTGEGGCVVTHDPLLAKIVASFRDWGRDCWCETGHDNTCGKRFEWSLGQLPQGYDHKYIYSHIGYNLKMTDMQAAIGLSQLSQLDHFVQARRKNWQALYDGLSGFDELLGFQCAQMDSQPSWFGFLMTIKPGAPFTRAQLLAFLEKRKIATRLLFGGNLVAQPAYQDVPLRIAGSLQNTNTIMQQSLWIGVHPGISVPMREFMLASIKEFIQQPKAIYA